MVSDLAVVTTETTWPPPIGSARQWLLGQDPSSINMNPIQYWRQRQNSLSNECDKPSVADGTTVCHETEMRIVLRIENDCWRLRWGSGYAMHWERECWWMDTWLNNRCTETQSRRSMAPARKTIAVINFRQCEITDQWKGFHHWTDIHVCSWDVLNRPM